MATGYHEADLSVPAREFHRAVTSLMEEMEAVDWYNQRADVTTDEQLKQILLHNRNEEIEHAAMILEWLRRMVPEIDGYLRTYLFSQGPVTEIEEEKTTGKTAGSPDNENCAKDLGIGRLKKGD